MAKELTTTNTFAVQNLDIKDLQEILAEAAGAGGITPQDLDKVTIPAGGSLAWTVPTLEGEETRKSIDGIIIHHQDARAYWAASIEDSGGAIPPDCSSQDGIFGNGTPGGACSKCPLAAFGSDKKSRGQACKALKIVFILLPDSLLPIVLPLPPTSIKVLKQYLLRLASRGIKASQVVSSFGLSKEKNLDGIAFSRVTLAMVSKITSDHVKSYAETFKKALGEVSVHPEDI